MVFASPFFLFAFLPIVLLVFALLPSKSARHSFLLFASIVFYVWGEGRGSLVLFTLVALNWLLATLIYDAKMEGAKRRFLWIAVALNVAALLYYKYFGLLLSTIGQTEALTIGSITASAPSLPIGISFVVFHLLSYHIDQSRKALPDECTGSRFFLYVFLFPQLIAGPIIRWHQISGQFYRDRVTVARAASGITLFCVGLAKKVLVANPLGSLVDPIFAAPVDSLTPRDIWLAVAAYSVQIYFDFSGYSDMARGLMRIFGFNIPPNFLYPYTSCSLSEFWRRWHISLSSWFRDYVYIPLGGNRTSPLKLYRNVLTVFLLSGIWHGANWTFAIWGLWHGVLVLAEKTLYTRQVSRTSSVLFGKLYFIIALMIGWTIFRADSLGHATQLLRRMFLDWTAFALPLNSSYLVGPSVSIALLVGFLSFVLPKRLLRSKRAVIGRKPVLQCLLSISILIVASSFVVAGGYNPFIYFRF